MNIAEGLVWLSERRFANDALAATYSRGEVDLSITVVPGRTEWESDGDEGAVVRMESPDFFVLVSDLGALSRPQAGDQIVYDSSVYEVMSPDGASPWQWADWPNRAVLRVHTKLVDTEE